MTEKSTVIQYGSVVRWVEKYLTTKLNGITSQREQSS